MKLTNKHNLPGPLVNAVKGFEKAYKDGRGNTSISVTELISPPLIKKLKEEYNDRLEEDVSERIWSLFGSAVHSVLEHAGGAADLTEERLFLDVEGIRISGQADLYEESGTLSDYKITSVWSVIGDKIKPEWVTQLNILALLYENTGFPVTKLQIVAILRDWSKGKAMAGGNYPECNVKVIDIPRWTKEATLDYIIERVKIHAAEPTECTPEEKWAKPPVYAVMKEGRKSAIKLYDTLEEAEADGRGDRVEVRPGENVRCKEYCPVKDFCPYYKESSDA